MIAKPEYVRRVRALPDPSPAMRAYIAATLENDGSSEQIDAAQAAYQALSTHEHEILRQISRSIATS